MFFTKREEEVIDLMLHLKTNEEIAKKLNLSVNTIASYKKRIMYKVKMAERTNQKKHDEARTENQAG